MSNLVSFLRARLDEDEGAAEAAVGFDYGVKDWADDGDPVNVHIARHDPARVLRDVAADRKLLAALENGETHEYAGLMLAIEIRAARFSDHPDYDPVWRPE